MRGLLEGQLDFGDATEREGGLNAQARRAQLFEGLAVQRSHARGEPFEPALYGVEGKLAEDRDDNLTAEVADVGRDGEPGGPLRGGGSEPAGGEHVVLAAHRDHLGNGGGFAFGTDRSTAIVAGEENIREVVAFPKPQSGLDPMTGSPTAINARHLNELGLPTMPPKASAGGRGVAWPACLAAAHGPERLEHADQY